MTWMSAATFSTSTGGSFASISSESLPTFFRVSYGLLLLLLQQPPSPMMISDRAAEGRPSVGIVYDLYPSDHAATKFRAEYSSERLSSPDTALWNLVANQRGSISAVPAFPEKISSQSFTSSSSPCCSSSLVSISAS